MRLKKLILVAVVVGLAASSCRVFDPSIMLRTPRDYAFDIASDSLPENYLFQPGDIVTFRLFSNQGFKIIDLTSLDDQMRGNAQYGNQNVFQYLVEDDSTINLPIIGRTAIGGLNLKEAELFLEDKYSNYYNDPFVMLRAENRRVIIFPGTSGEAQVITLTNAYTSVIEALAMVGGITDRGKAHRVKIVRGNLKDPEVYELDLSTLEGMKEANYYYVRANDIIYVEPSYFIYDQTLQRTSQILAITSSIILTYFLIVSLN